MYLLFLLLPLLGSVFAGLFGRFLGNRGSVVITVTFLFLTFLCTLIAFYEVALCGSVCSIKVQDWFSCEMFDCSWGFYFDSLTVVMCVVITSVSFLVHLYSVDYMSEDPHLSRFMSFLSIFTFFMLMLVCGDNLLVMFLGWEGVGLASYLLISFWFTRLSASKASIKAMLVNRVGDFGLALGIFSIFCVFKSVSFPVIFSLAPLKSEETLVFLNCEFHAYTVIAICLFVGAVGKSAQLGLHTWLPDAMEGPTPVSALIHAATMVTAGVFMVARCSPLFEFAPDALTVIALLGGMTCFFAATTGVVQNDLKRVIAYSTCSQLGYMVFALGVSSYSVAVFHLMNHAFFKALLFLSAGSVIHAISSGQDMRKMGGLASILPFTSAMIFIGSLSLAGFPFLTGFYSKDLILEVAFAKYTVSASFAAIIGGFCVFLTAYYSFRLSFLTFFTTQKSQLSTLLKSHDAPYILALPLALLSLGSIFIGYLGQDMLIGVGTSFWGNAIFISPESSNLFESHWQPQAVKLFPFCLTVLGIVFAYFLTTIPAVAKKGYTFKTSNVGKTITWFLSKRWFFDKLYNDLFAQKAAAFGYQISFKNLDKGLFEIFGPQGSRLLFSKATREVSHLQSGMIYHYAFVMVIGLTGFITIVSLWDFLSVHVDNRLSFAFCLAFIAFLTLPNKSVSSLKIAP